MTMYFVRTMGEESGPLTAAQLKEMAANNQILRDSYVRKDGGDWVIAEKVNGLAFKSPPVNYTTVKQTRKITKNRTRKLLLIILACVFFVGLSVFSIVVWKESVDHRRNQIQSTGDIEIRVDNSVIYVGRGQQKDTLLKYFLRVGLKGSAATAGMLDVDGSPVEVTFESSSTNVIRFTHDDPEQPTGPRFKATIQDRIHFVSGGESVITATAGALQGQITIKVVEFGFSENDPATDVIKSIGFPDEKKRVVVPFDKTSIVDGVDYYPDYGDGSGFSEHWFYDKYPELVIAIDSDKVYRIENQ